MRVQTTTEPFPNSRLRAPAGVGRFPARAFVVAALTLILTVPAPAQMYRTGQSSVPETREELRSRLQQLESLVESEAKGERVQDARRRIEVIRQRLDQGDFQPGDVVRLRVRSDTALTGTFRVSGQRALELPSISDVSLSGVLYSEADSVVREHLGQYIRDPNVRVEVTRRIAILGAVQNPGFYDLVPTTTLSDALMAAGGPTGNAKLEGIKLRRNGSDVLAGRDPNLQRVTLAELGPSQDDQLVVPQAGGGFGALDAMGIISGVSGTVWAITRIF